MGDTYRVVTPDFINLEITTSADNNACSVQRRFPKSITIGELKGKMELQTGASVATMTLEVYNKENALVTKLDNDNALLGSYHIEDNMRLHVRDNFTLRNEFQNASKVDKYDIPKEIYDKREDTVKSFLQKNKLGRYNEELLEAKKQAMQKLIEEQIEAAKKFQVGERCVVSVVGEPKRRGTIKYVGELDKKPGWWIGVHYDEPLGKHNGTVNGKTYFVCPDKYGAFVKPFYVEQGDFPEENDLDEEL